MRRRYRILHVITRLELGGAQQNTLFCLLHHDRARFDVGLLAGPGGLLDGEAQALAGARVHLLGSLRHAVAPPSDLRALVELRSYLKARPVDLVHTHSSKAGILGRLAAHLAGVPVVVHTVHGWSFNDTQPGWLRRLFVLLERSAARLTHRLIVVSSRNRDQGLAAGIGRPEQYAVIRSGIDFDEFRSPARGREAVRRELGIDPAAVLVGTIACLKPQKAPCDFVRAAAAAHARDDRLRFIMVGDGPLEPEVRRLIGELRLERVVRLLGWRRDVADLLHAMDLFLLTSLHEGLPRSVLQAMAAGVPVVATAVDGTPEVVRHRETGLLVPPSRPEAAAQGVLELVADRALAARCIGQARRALVRAFDIHEMVADLDRLYLGLLEGA